MMFSRLTGVWVGLAMLASTSAANAAPITITGYDITGASISGTGNWAHVYSGTITPTGGHTADYSGGTGTMADGIIGNSVGTTQLFCSASNCFSDPSRPPVDDITFFLDGFHSIDSIEIFGGDHGNSNSIPGAITGLDVTFGGTTASIVTSPFGLPGNSGQPVNDLLSLVGTSLDGLITNQVSFSNFLISENGSDLDRFSITEVRIFSSAVAVPEPAAMTLLCIGLVATGFVARKRRAARLLIG